MLTIIEFFSIFIKNYAAAHFFKEKFSGTGSFHPP